MRRKVKRLRFGRIACGHTTVVGIFCGLALASLTSGCDSEKRLAPLDAQQITDDPELVAYLDAFPHEKYEVLEVPGVGKFYVDDNPALVKEAIRNGKPWEPHIILEFVDYVVPGSTVLDVGAHIGSLTIPLALLTGPEGRVYAFEPQRKVFRELVYNLWINELDHVTPLRLAASSEPGVIQMDPIDGFDGRVSIGEGGDTAEARTIDSFGLSDVSLIKIDVEGHEIDVLRGAQETIATSHPVILLEIWRENLEAVNTELVALGYELRRIVGHDYIAEYSGSE